MEKRNTKPLTEVLVKCTFFLKRIMILVFDRSYTLELKKNIDQFLLSKVVVLPRPRCFHGSTPISDQLYYKYLLGELKGLVFLHTKQHWSPKILMQVEYLAESDPKGAIYLSIVTTE